MGGISDSIHNLEEIKEELRREEGELKGDELEKRARAVALRRGQEKARKEAIRKREKNQRPHNFTLSMLTLYGTGFSISRYT